jgi:hypothetical protein
VLNLIFVHAFELVDRPQLLVLHLF